MGRSCILESHPGRWMPAAVRMPAVVRMPACHSRRFKGERPMAPPQANKFTNRANHQSLVPNPANRGGGPVWILSGDTGPFSPLFCSW